MSDVRIINEGTLIGVHPLTAEASQWIDENVQSEVWQWTGKILWVDHRMAGDLINGMVAAGLEVAS